MMNIIEINGYRAVVQYDPEIDMLRGEFIGLNGGADFYATDIDGLRKEGEISLKVFLDMCREEDLTFAGTPFSSRRPPRKPGLVREGIGRSTYTAYPAGLREFVRGMATPTLYDVIKDAQPVGEPVPHKIPSNLRRYVGKLHHAAHHAAEVSVVFLKVINLLAPPPSILAPRIVWRVWRGNMRPPPTTHAQGVSAAIARQSPAG
jgi:hypothetical protein